MSEEVDKKERCEFCNGSGIFKQENGDFLDCIHCEGTGSRKESGGDVLFTNPCATCGFEPADNQDLCSVNCFIKTDGTRSAWKLKEKLPEYICTLKEQNDCDQEGSMECLKGKPGGIPTMRVVCIHGKKELEKEAEPEKKSIVRCPYCQSIDFFFCSNCESEIALDDVKKLIKKEQIEQFILKLKDFHTVEKKDCFGENSTYIRVEFIWELIKEYEGD